MNKVLSFKRCLLILLAISALSFAVRGLTMRFIRDRLTDRGWFQSGSYAIVDRTAQSILDGKSSILWMDDPSQIESAIYPPGYPLWIAFIYKVTGERSAAAVQRVQWILDALSLLLVVGIGMSAFNWRVGLWAGLLAALSPLLALYGVAPGADAPTSWIVLVGVWCLVISAKRQCWRWALAAGLIAGTSCWFRANAMLLVFFWALALLLVIKSDVRRRSLLAGSAVLGMVLVVTPIIVRNAKAFQAFVPTGLGLGTNLWEGIGETERAAEFGAVYGDDAVVEQERAARGLPADAPFGLYSPDGVQRDRERTRKAIHVIASHPLWYLKVMARRMWGTLNFAGEPSPFYGYLGINLTSKRLLPPDRQTGILALVVNVLGMAQSVMRHVLLFLVILGLWFAFKSDWRMASLVISTPLYYLSAGSAMHMEIRYGLPMQAILLVIAGVAISELLSLANILRHKLAAPASHLEH